MSSSPQASAVGEETASLDELYQQAKEANIEGRSKMTKDELVRALQR